AQVEVRRHSAADQCGQQWVVEGAPPLGELRWLRAHAAVLCLAPRGGHGWDGRTIARSYRTATEHRHTTQHGPPPPPPHGLPRPRGGEAAVLSDMTGEDSTDGAAMNTSICCPT